MRRLRIAGLQQGLLDGLLLCRAHPSVIDGLSFRLGSVRVLRHTLEFRLQVGDSAFEEDNLVLLELDFAGEVHEVA